MMNLSITSKRCKGATTTYRPTICPQRNQCQRHVQINLDRQLQLPDEIVKFIPVMQMARVGTNECHYFVEAT